jgi:hypothetical protein
MQNQHSPLFTDSYMPAQTNQPLHPEA